MTPCIEWPMARSKGGYGQVWQDGRLVYAHRAVWRVRNGPIPEGMCVLHRCDNPPCINFDHLFLGTIADNNRDMRAKGRSSPPPHHRGSRNPAARLTPDQVAAIRADNRPGPIIAADYGVHFSTIYRIRRRETWA